MQCNNEDSYHSVCIRINLREKKYMCPSAETAQAVEQNFVRKFYPLELVDKLRFNTVAMFLLEYINAV